MSLQDPTEDRPTKRVRTESASKSPAPVVENIAFDDDDDLYDTPAQPSETGQKNHQAERDYVNIITSPPRSSAPAIPGLGMLSSEPPQVENDYSVSAEASPQTIPAPGMLSKDKAASSISSEETVGCNEPDVIKKDPIGQMPVDSGHRMSERRPSDLAFIEAAIANHDNPRAEFEYDSDADRAPSSNSSETEPDSDDSEEVDYELLRPEEAVKILMRGEAGGSDDEGGKKKKGGGGSQPRTTNEKPEERVPKPSITITPEMKISELGHVSQMVGSDILIKGTISAETQILERGSVLCLADRTLIGAIQEPLGRVDEPLYQATFTSSVEIAEFGIEKGTKIFYVEDHAIYLFTQALKLLKGSDASNVHDEEVEDEEMEFSDDEAEAEYKKKRKAEKAARKETKSSKDNVSGTGSNGLLHPTSAVRADYPSQAMNYDDDEEADEELYTPLARPTNLHEMNAAPPPSRPSRGGQERGGASSRGRGDRGRGDVRGARGGRENRDDYNQGRGGQRGNKGDLRGNKTDKRGKKGRGVSNNVVNNDQQGPENTNAPQSTESTPNNVPPQLPQAAIGPPIDHNWMGGAYTQVPPAHQYFAPHPADYNHGRYEFPTPMASVPFIPPGAHINPAFYHAPAASPPPFAAQPPPPFPYHQYQYPQVNYNNYYSHYQPQHFNQLNPQQSFGHQQQQSELQKLNMQQAPIMPASLNHHVSPNPAIQHPSQPSAGAGEAIRAMQEQLRQSASNHPGAS